MRKIISMLHISLDGFSSGPNHELDWISYDKDLEAYAHSLHARTDAVIWGRNTYEGMAGYWLTVPNNPDSSPAELEHVAYLENATKIVVSRTLDRIDWAGNTKTLLIKDHIAEQINALKQQPGKDIWFLGSVGLLQTFIDLDLIDEYRFNVNPVILGQGRRMITDVQSKHQLTLTESNTLKSGVVTLVYEPVRS